MMILGCLLGLGVMTVFGLAEATAASAPFSVRTASLSQDGEQLIWTVQLDHRFSPAGLEADKRTLCLVIEREAGGSVAGELCVLPGRRAPQLVYQHITARGPAPGHAIVASVSRSSASSLSATFLPSAIDVAYTPIRWQVVNTLAPPRCGPRGCTTWFPAQPALAALHTPMPVGCVASGAPYVTSGPSSLHEIALTFDDGPWYDTPQFLDILEREHVPATFFQVGVHESQYGSVDRRILADRDMIGDHTETHADVAGGGPFAVSEISDAAAAIGRASGGFQPCLFRAPGGAVSPGLISLARSMGFTTIEWDIDPRDWARPGVDAIYNNVIANAHNGAIVIQHDGGGDRSQTLAALPREIATLRSRGYGFVTVTQLLGQRLIYK
jgi:peptidoglycan/xylan/chitin deacetylase (PgdA/CDA1 family)